MHVCVCVHACMFVCVLQVGDTGEMKNEGCRGVVTGVLTEAVAWKDGWTHLSQARRLLSFALPLCGIREVSWFLWALLFSSAT